MTRTWKEQLQQQLVKKLGATKGKRLAEKYAEAYPVSYCAQNNVETAASDLSQVEKLSVENPFLIDLYNDSASEFPLHFKLFQYGKPLPLSDILPMIENMDLRTYSECPFSLSLGKQNIWISDFSVEYARGNLDIASVENVFEEAFTKVRFGITENDGFNRLVLAVLTAIAMPLTYSIAEGISFGFISYVAIKLLSLRFRDLNLPLILLALAFVAKYIFLIH